ncbi:glycosyltransferase family 2 protein [Brunnivagina elsteri]|uniref:Glycosyl transferase family 2 n=1 Tax=Brunnivagina elsteri CCALA 953 TaxID=987040 RepID=A0A2A2TPP6_9CYAN|nr:glycosyltransferase [Calothrix elsteri]PAX60496.1 glycosyl transferase family 2 [Calothrix elsteri CCALA 953]
MKISIVIPCFNATQTLPLQLEALANQEYSHPWEVIISDNGSTDNTEAIAQQFQEKIPNLRIIGAATIKGAAHARNVGALAATGEAILFCDADDEVAPRWIEAMAEALAKYDFVAGCMECTKLNEKWVQKSRFFPQQSDDFPKYGLMHMAASCNLGIKRSLHEKINGFDESIPAGGEDDDYCLRLQQIGISLHFVPTAAIHYRFRDSFYGIYQQSYSYAKTEILVYQRHKHRGVVAPVSWKSLIRRLIFLPAKLLKVRDRGDLAKWLWDLGELVGRSQGYFKYMI